MGWCGVATATAHQEDTIFLPPLRIFLQFFIAVFCCFIFIAKEISPKILVEIKLDIFNIRENLVFLHTIYTFDCDNVKYKMSSRILHHVIPPVKICHP